MFKLDSRELNAQQQQISKHKYSDERTCVMHLLKITEGSIAHVQEEPIKQLAKKLITTVRTSRIKGSGVDALMQEFKLSTAEGIALMCVAESLLRIPDKKTQDKLIRDKIRKGNWRSHIGGSNTFINAASWGLVITGKLVDSLTSDKLTATLLRVLARGGEPLIRRAMTVAIKFMGNQFIMGETIESALKEAIPREAKGYKFSYDMLGEAAVNGLDAEKYLQKYIDAITAVGKASRDESVHNNPGISIKLSALHPQYVRAHHDKVISELYPRVKQLYLLARKYKIGLFIDAEESTRLELSLELFTLLVHDKDLQGFDGIGFVIQAYQKAALYVVKYVANLAQITNNKIMVRLVKGAYWDSEIKQAQLNGLVDYPVFTRKFYTDLSYIACSAELLNHQDCIYPLFATHNAHTLASVYYMAQGKHFEFQCLYGMGESLYNNVVGASGLNIPCRVYAPVGTHDTLLAYLVRRLLENGANSSFVHQIIDKSILIDELVTSPLELAKKAHGESNPNIVTPPHIYPDGRANSKGLDLNDEATLFDLQNTLNDFAAHKYKAYPLIANYSFDMAARAADLLISPANSHDIVGEVWAATPEEVDIAVAQAADSFNNWAITPPGIRAQALFDTATRMEACYPELIALLVREAGKTFANAVSEIREAIDFCRYYATQVVNEFDNHTHKALGPIVCISPWNFPLAIFMGEVVSALAAGNTVLAKPAYQTSLIAFYAVKLLHESGVPAQVLQFIPGSGSKIGDKLTAHPDIKGVIFTGSTDVARTINQHLALNNSLPVLIAETGGQNVMIVDSSALPEQVVNDVIASGFDSAGQRCSALRVLYLQDDIADKILDMLKGAMQELCVGNPCNLTTDVGPVINQVAKDSINKHISKMRKHGCSVYQTPITDVCHGGTYVAPTLIEISSISQLEQEIFGPVVHVVRFASKDLDKVIIEINSSGYGLTQGLHSRIEETAAKVYENVRAGNFYINRNMIGAVVGVQPFGGEGLSGTGPKAGGPFYVYRLIANGCHEKNPVFIERGVHKFRALKAFLASLHDCGFDAKECEQLHEYAATVYRRSIIDMRIDLPGPTGEQNFMFFANRGTIACFATTQMEYAKQIICALGTGNAIVLSKNKVTEQIAKMVQNKKIAKNLGWISIVANPVKAQVLHGAMLSASYIEDSILRKELAARDGILTTLISEQDDGYYDLHLLLTEHTVSINTTASGGNTQLMSLSDKI